MSLNLFAQQAEANREERIQNGPDFSERAYPLIFTSGKPFRGKFLIPIETALPSDLHNFNGNQPIPGGAICNNMYPVLSASGEFVYETDSAGKVIQNKDGTPKIAKRVCEVCQSTGKYGACTPKTCWSFLFYCFDLVGEKRPSKKNPTKTYEVNPVVVVDIPVGKNRKNIDKLLTAATDGRLYRKIWQLKSVEGDGFQTPETLDPEDMGDQAPTVVPEDVIQRYAVPRDKSGNVIAPGEPERDEYDKRIRSLLLAPRQNVDWKYLGLTNPWAANEQKPAQDGAADESKPKLNGAASGDALSAGALSEDLDAIFASEDEIPF